MSPVYHTVLPVKMWLPVSLSLFLFSTSLVVTRNVHIVIQPELQQVKLQNHSDQ